jgi:HEAT repeat protein
MIALTAAACLTALLFRTPIRSRYWAWQVVHSGNVAERAAPLTCLCNAGDAGRWGARVLLAHPDPEIRQFGVLVLQHVRSDWSRRRLLQMLADPSAAVREMAALGLALQGDDTVIPELKRLYAGSDAESAAAACLALERLATPEAVAALTELVRVEPAANRSTASATPDVIRRAALVDALAAIGTVDCAAALLDLLDDCRACDLPTRDERLLARLTPLAVERGLIETPASQLSPTIAGRTIAERAASALAHITGLSPRFACELPREQREDAARVWHDWVGARREAP